MGGGGVRGEDSRGCVALCVLFMCRRACASTGIRAFHMRRRRTGHGAWNLKKEVEELNLKLPVSIQLNINQINTPAWSHDSKTVFSKNCVLRTISLELC